MNLSKLFPQNIHVLSKFRFQLFQQWDQNVSRKHYLLVRHWLTEVWQTWNSVNKLFPFLSRNLKKGKKKRNNLPSACQLSVTLLMCQEQRNCNLQTGRRWEAWEEGVGKQSTATSGWFKGAVTVNLFTHKVESLAHSDNTVNSNQDPVISNYRPRVAGDVVCVDVAQRHVWGEAVYSQGLLFTEVFFCFPTAEQRAELLFFFY